jgi:phosphonate transport system permease protein
MESFALDVDTYSQQNSKKIIKKIIFYISLVVIIVFSVYFIIVLDTDWHRIGSGGGILEQLSYFVGLDFTIMKHLIVPTFETFLMACLGTMLGLFLSLPVAWLGARNVTPLGMASFGFARFLMTISRSVHEIIWALIFVGAVGLGALPGILALAFRSVGFISKIISESIEGADKKPIEAIRAAGGSGFDIMYYGIIPQILPTVIGTIIFEWDINIRRSAIMGLVGAGGLGLAFFRQMHMSNYPGVTTVIMFIFLLIIIGEILSHFLRKKIN